VRRLSLQRRGPLSPGHGATTRGGAQAGGPIPWHRRLRSIPRPWRPPVLDLPGEEGGGGGRLGRLAEEGGSGGRPRQTGGPRLGAGERREWGGGQHRTWCWRKGAGHRRACVPAWGRSRWLIALGGGRRCVCLGEKKAWRKKWFGMVGFRLEEESG
jgi:hypothetical protein